MYLVQSKKILELFDLWRSDLYGQEPKDPAPLPESLTLSDNPGLTSVRYWDPDAPLTPPPAEIIDEVLQHYLNQYVPATWSLVGFSQDDTTFRFVWRKP
jgi:hypothetical protein